MDEAAIRREVWETVLKLNRLWTEEGNPGALKEYFHENMVAITPTDRERRQGREACLAGWTDFARAARIQHWKTSIPLVQLYGGGGFAVVTYYYDMSFEMGGRTVAASGRDMLALVREDGRWWVVADQFSPYPQ